MVPSTSHVSHGAKLRSELAKLRRVLRMMRLFQSSCTVLSLRLPTIIFFPQSVFEALLLAPHNQMTKASGQLMGAGLFEVCKLGFLDLFPSVAKKTQRILEEYPENTRKILREYSENPQRRLTP